MYCLLTGSFIKVDHFWVISYRQLACSYIKNAPYKMPRTCAFIFGCCAIFCRFGRAIEVMVRVYYLSIFIFNVMLFSLIACRININFDFSFVVIAAFHWSQSVETMCGCVHFGVRKRQLNRFELRNKTFSFCYIINLFYFFHKEISINRILYNNNKHKNLMHC